MASDEGFGCEARDQAAKDPRVLCRATRLVELGFVVQRIEEPPQWLVKALVPEILEPRLLASFRQEREFVEGRLAQSMAELTDAEARYEAFLTSNRLFDSPQLSFERDRHEREVNMLQQVVTSLRTSAEQARIEAVRNTPAITVLDPARAPVKGNGRGTLRRAAIRRVVAAWRIRTTHAP